MQKNEKESNVIKLNYCLSSKSAVGLFLFSFFEPKSLLEASHRLAANVEALAKAGNSSTSVQLLTYAQ